MWRQQGRRRHRRQGEARRGEARRGEARQRGHTHRSTRLGSPRLDAGSSGGRGSARSHHIGGTPASRLVRPRVKAAARHARKTASEASRTPPWRARWRSTAPRTDAGRAPAGTLGCQGAELAHQWQVAVVLVGRWRGAAAPRRSRTMATPRTRRRTMCGRRSCTPKPSVRPPAPARGVTAWRPPANAASQWRLVRPCASELAPRNTAYLTNRAAAYTMRKLYKEALDDCLAALDIEPGNAKVRPGGQRHGGARA